VARVEIDGARREWLQDNGKERAEAGRASSGSDGRFSIALPAGRYELALSADGLASGIVNLDLEPGGTEDLDDIELSAATPSAGLVVDSSGRGVAGAWVTVRADNRDEDSDAILITTVRTDAKGRFTAPSAAFPIFRIQAVAPGVPVAHNFRSSGPGRRAGGSSTIRLDRGRRISGIVRRPDGSPAPGVLVSGSGHAVETAGDGTFSLNGASADPETIVASGADLRAATLVRRDVARVELKLTPAARVTGSVIDAITRRPIASRADRSRATRDRRWRDGSKGRFEVGSGSGSGAPSAWGRSAPRAFRPVASPPRRPLGGDRARAAATIEGRWTRRNPPVGGARVASCLASSVRSAKVTEFAFVDGWRPAVDLKPPRRDSRPAWPKASACVRARRRRGSS
jgi:hypothetical protein